MADPQIIVLPKPKKGVLTKNYTESVFRLRNTIAVKVAVIIPEGVTEVGDSVFKDCKNIVSITLPKTLTKIGEYAFSSCRSLVSITFPEGLKYISNSAFYGCINLESITLPEGLKGIGESAFWFCMKLKSITLPEGLTEIDGHAFWWCTDLESIILPESLIKIGKSLFYGCDSLETISAPTSIHRLLEKQKISKYSKSSLKQMLENGSKKPKLQLQYYWSLSTHNKCKPQAKKVVKTLMMIMNRMENDKMENDKIVTLPQELLTMEVLPFLRRGNLS